MWCCHCRCEVAAEPSAGAGETRCAECQAAVTAANDSPPRDSEDAPAASQRAPHLQRFVEDLDLADDLRRARRLLRVDRAEPDHQPVGLAALLADEPASGGTVRRDRRRPGSRRRQAGASWGARLWGTATWLIVCAGGMGLTFGAALVASTQFLHAPLFREGLARRDDLWTWGLLTAMAGQFLLFLGFACRWSSSRAATNASDPNAAPAGGRAKRDRAAAATPSPAPPLAPLWSARCEAALGLSLDGLDGA